MLCFHAAQTGKRLLWTQNVSEQNQKHFLCPGHKICVRDRCCARGQTGKHLCRQCVLVCQGNYLGDAKLYLESKASFIDISIIASFKLFFDCLVAGILHFFGQFRGQLEVLALAKIHPVGNYFPKKKIVFHYQTFFLLQICSLLDCS